VGSQEIGYGRGNAIRTAKREAAVEALQSLRANPRGVLQEQTTVFQGNATTMHEIVTMNLS
jgi:hypothetical protein